MAVEPENIILAHLRRFDAKLDRIADDVRDIKVRMSATETQIGTINSRLDRIEDRIEHIERRLGLIDAPPL